MLARGGANVWTAGRAAWTRAVTSAPPPAPITFTRPLHSLARRSHPACLNLSFVVTPASLSRSHPHTRNMSAAAAPQVCEGCLKPGDAAAPVTLTGSEQTVGGHDTYVVGNSKPAVIIGTDIFGWRFPKTRAVAEHYASQGFTVFIPRYIGEGDEAVPEKMANFDFPAWLGRNTPQHAGEVLLAVAKEVAAKHSPVLLAGFCFGAKPVVEVLKANVGPNAAALFHPSLLTEEDAPALLARKSSLVFLCAETDRIFTEELRAHFEKVLAGEKNVRFIDHPGTQHGFAIRGTGEVEVAQGKKAHEEAIAFFKSNL